jgi:hypothetical protein
MKSERLGGQVHSAATLRKPNLTANSGLPLKGVGPEAVNELR